MGKRRLVELGKDILILLLSASAVWLLTMTPLIRDSGLADLFSGSKQTSQGEGAVSLSVAANPSRMAVTGSGGRYGLQYDQEGVDELFARFGPLLGEGLTSAEVPQSISEGRWQDYLTARGIYYDFDRSVPLSALGSWLNPEGACVLDGTARRVLLVAGGGDKVLLCYQDGVSGRFYSCRTKLSGSLHLEPLLEGVEGNGAQFAFESETLSGLLQPYTLVTEVDSGSVYTVQNPLSGEGGAQSVLDALAFSGENHVPVSGGEAWLDGSARLEITDGGSAICSAGEEGKYPVVIAGEQATVAEIIEAARGLAESTVGVYCGEARLYLESVQELEEGWRVRFGYRLNGSAVWLYDEGWAAEVYIAGGYITEFTLHFRSYAYAGREELLLPMDWTAVLLPEVSEELRELVIRYRDPGSTEVLPVWVVE